MANADALSRLPLETPQVEVTKPPDEVPGSTVHVVA